MPENLQNEQSSCSFSNTVTRKTNYNGEKCASNVKKMNIHREQNFEGEANKMQLDKEDTR